MTAHITRHFVTIGHRQVHYRRAGDGPALLMLHASLNTSATFLPLIGPLARDFTVIAMDTPGYGQSDLLSSRVPEIEDYADGVIEFLDALGLKRVALYGMLTGTMIGVDLASRYPERFSAVILNTMLVHTDAELREFERKFTPEMPPRSDGLHLVQAWDLMRRNAIAYPWFKPGRDTRFNLPMPPPAELHLRLMNCLSAGAEYGWGAVAAFRFLRRVRIADIRAPTVFFSDRIPPFGSHGERLEPLPEGTSLHRFNDWSTLWEDIASVLRDLPAADPAPPPPPAAPIAGRFTSDCVSSGAGWLHLRRSADGPGRPVVLIHGAGGSARLVEVHARSLIGKRPVVAFDWPGHGESSSWPSTDSRDLYSLAEHIRAGLRAIGMERVDVFAVECGAAVGLELAALEARLIRSLAWNEVLFPPDDEFATFAERYAPRIEYDHHGGYLLKAWGFLRDQSLYWPWFDKSEHAIILDLPDIDIDRQHERALALLKAVPDIRRAYAAGFDAKGRIALDRFADRIRVCSFPKDPFGANARAVAADLGGAPRILGEDRSRWVAEALT